MKKFSLSTVLFLVMILFTGCHNNIDLEDRNYVMGLGVDWANNQYAFSFAFPDLAALTGKGENIHYPVANIEAVSFEEAASLYARQANKRIDFGQLQSMVIGRELFKNEDKMEELLNYFKSNQEFSRTILVCMADDQARDIIDLDESVNGSIGLYIRDMFDNNSEDLFNENISVGDLIIGMSNPEKEINIPCMTVDEESAIPKIIKYELIQGFSFYDIQ